MRLALLLTLAAVGLAASGCVHTQPAGLDTAAGRVALNARTAGRVATLHLSSGRRAARDLHIGPDETLWTDRLSGAPQSAPTSDVRAVSTGRGSVWRSALVGAGIGAALGAVVAETSGCSSFVCFPPAYFVAGFGLIGTFVGAAAGVAQTDRYRVNDAAANTGTARDPAAAGAAQTAP